MAASYHHARPRPSTALSERSWHDVSQSIVPENRVNRRIPQSEHALVILQPGEKLPSLAEVDGDFADWARRGMGVSRDCAHVVYPHRGDALPDPASVQAALVTGSSAMVTDRASWMENAAHWLRDVVEGGAAVLGICFGHQLLAQALGGEVSDNPRGVEVGTVEVRLQPAATGDPLFTGLPATMNLHVSHRQSVMGLPPGATALARSDLDDHQAFVVGDRAWGVQFHPEFSAPIISGYIEYHAAKGGLVRDGSTLLAEVRDTPFGGILLRNFARVAGLAGG